MRRLNMVSNTNWTPMTILLLGALTVMFGVQLLRTLFVGMAVYLTQVQEISPMLVGVLGLAVFLCGFLAPVAQRAIGPRYVLPVIVGLLSLAWLAEKFISSLPADLGLSIAGTVLFLWCLPLLFRSIPTTGNNGTASHAVVALLVGLSADTAVKGVFGTVDLSWAQGVAGYVAAAGLAGVQVFLLWRLASVSSRELEQEPPASAWPYMALGPALALQFLLFQNVAHQTVMIGWPQPAVYAWILAANLAGVAVAIELTRWDRNPTWPILGLLGGILVAIVTVDLSGFPAALIVLVGQVLMAVLLVSIVRASRESAVERSGRSISTWAGVGMIILLALLFIYYANYDTDVLVPKEAVRPLAALMIGLAALQAGLARHAVREAVTRFASIPALLLLILPLVYLATWKDVEPIQGAGYPVRVMSYNLHQGFDVHGSHGLEDIAKVIGGRGSGHHRAARGFERLGRERLRRYAGMALAAPRNGLRVGSGGRSGVGQRDPEPTPDYQLPKSRDAQQRRDPPRPGVSRSRGRRRRWRDDRRGSYPLPLWGRRLSDQDSSSEGGIGGCRQQSDYSLARRLQRPPRSPGDAPVR